MANTIKSFSPLAGKWSCDSSAQEYITALSNCFSPLAGKWSCDFKEKVL